MHQHHDKTAHSDICRCHVDPCGRDSNQTTLFTSAPRLFKIYTNHDPKAQQIRAYSSSTGSIQSDSYQSISLRLDSVIQEQGICGTSCSVRIGTDFYFHHDRLVYSALPFRRVTILTHGQSYLHIVFRLCSPWSHPLSPSFPSCRLRSASRSGRQLLSPAL